MAKANTKSKKKSYKLTPKVALLALVLIAGLAAVGTLGYNKIRYGSFTAGAYNWGQIAAARVNGGSVFVRACAVRSGGPYRTYLLNQSSYYASINGYQVRPHSNSPVLLYSNRSATVKTSSGSFGVKFPDNIIC